MVGVGRVVDELAALLEPGVDRVPRDVDVAGGLGFGLGRRLVAVFAEPVLAALIGSLIYTALGLVIESALERLFSK